MLSGNRKGDSSSRYADVADLLDTPVTLLLLHNYDIHCETKNPCAIRIKATGLRSQPFRRVDNRMIESERIFEESAAVKQFGGKRSVAKMF